MLIRIISLEKPASTFFTINNSFHVVVSYNAPFLPTLNSQTVKLFFFQGCQRLDAKMAANSNLALILEHPIRSIIHSSFFTNHVDIKYVLVDRTLRRFLDSFIFAMEI